MTTTRTEAPDWLLELIEKVHSLGPQPLSLPGKPEMTIVPTLKFKLMCERKPTFKEALTNLNLEAVDLARDPTPTRDLDLE